MMGAALGSGFPREGSLRKSLFRCCSQEIVSFEMERVQLRTCPMVTIGRKATLECFDSHRLIPQPKLLGFIVAVFILQ